MVKKTSTGGEGVLVNNRVGSKKVIRSANPLKIELNIIIPARALDDIAISAGKEYVIRPIIVKIVSKAKRIIKKLKN